MIGTLCFSAIRDLQRDQVLALGDDLGARALAVVLQRDGEVGRVRHDDVRFGHRGHHAGPREAASDGGERGFDLDGDAATAGPCRAAPAWSSSAAARRRQRFQAVVGEHRMPTQAKRGALRDAERRCGLRSARRARSRGTPTFEARLGEARAAGPVAATAPTTATLASALSASSSTSSSAAAGCCRPGDRVRFCRKSGRRACAVGRPPTCSRAAPGRR